MLSGDSDTLQRKQACAWKSRGEKSTATLLFSVRNKLASSTMLESVTQQGRTVLRIKKKEKRKKKKRKASMDDGGRKRGKTRMCSRGKRPRDGEENEVVSGTHTSLRVLVSRSAVSLDGLAGSVKHAGEGPPFSQVHERNG